MRALRIIWKRTRIYATRVQVQYKNILLATTAINLQDTLDGFALNMSQPLSGPLRAEPNDGARFKLFYFLCKSQACMDQIVLSQTTVSAGTQSPPPSSYH